MLSGNNKLDKTPAGSLAKAWSVGAKTVKGPAPVKVVSKLAALRAVTNFEKIEILDATSKIFLVSALTIKLNDAVVRTKTAKTKDLRKLNIKMK